MNIRHVRSLVALTLGPAVLTLSGCGGQSRGNADAESENRAAKPSEGGATSTAGSAGESKNYGDTRTKTEVDGRSPSASPTGLSQDATAEHNVKTSGAGASTGQQSQPTRPKEEAAK